MSDSRLKAVIAGVEQENPATVASGIVSASGRQIQGAYDAGFGGVVGKTTMIVPTRSTKSRYWQLVIAGLVRMFMNIELLNERKVALFLHEMKVAKECNPGKRLWGSFMADRERQQYFDIIGMMLETRVDGVVLNGGCPQGFKKRGIGIVTGSTPEYLTEAIHWSLEAIGGKVPLLIKLPSVDNIDEMARVAFAAGAHGVAAINTISGLCAIDRHTLEPELNVAGYSVPGGCSGPFVRPFGRKKVWQIANVIANEGFKDRSLFAVGGIGLEGRDDDPVADAWSAIEYLLLGADAFKIHTAIQTDKRRFKIVTRILEGILRFMDERGYNSLSDFRGIRRERFLGDQPELLPLEDRAIASSAALVANDAAEWVSDDTQTGVVADENPVH